jgi:hypothetical protein
MLGQVRHGGGPFEVAVLVAGLRVDNRFDQGSGEGRQDMRAESDPTVWDWSVAAHSRRVAVASVSCLTNASSGRKCPKLVLGSLCWPAGQEIPRTLGMTNTRLTAVSRRDRADTQVGPYERERCGGDRD